MRYQLGFKYSITLHSFRKIEPLEQTLARLKEQGYDAVEMYGEPDQIDFKKIIESAASYGLPICGITGMWGRASSDGWKRRLLSLDQDTIKHSENYVRECIKMCQDIGGNEINICLFADSSLDFDANHGLVSEDQKKSALDNAIPLL